MTTHESDSTPAVETTATVEPETPAPEVYTVRKCMQSKCRKLVPGEGWCCHRCKDIWLREMNLTFRKQIPANIRVEIAKRGSVWNNEWKKVVAEYNAELRRRQQAEREAKVKEVAESVTKTEVAV